MNNIFENIQFNSDIPIKIFVHNLNYTQNHWHDALEILFVLEGDIHIGIGTSAYHLQKEDLIVINPNEIHTTSAKAANLVLVLQISSEWLNKYSAFHGIQISCNSCSGDKLLHMNQLRKQLAQMLWVYNNQSACFELKLQSYLFELLYQLYVYFQAGKQPQGLNENEKYIPRLSNIIHFLHENYEKDITLQDLADKEFLSVSYISRYFKKYIGTSFKEYIIRLRLEHAVKDLLFTEKSIAQLSFDNGFPNTNSFLSAFREAYHEAPSIYRKKAKADYNFLYGPNSKADNYFKIENIDMFTSLFKYLNWNSDSESPNDSSGSVSVDLGEVDLRKETTQIADSWRTLMAIGKAMDILNPVIQEQLIIVQKEIGFRYLRFHGIFDDEMLFYHEDSEGNPVMNYTLIDQVIDFLYDINLKPFLELSFMPELLTKSRHIVFSHRASIIGMPDNLEKWSLMLKDFLLHCMNRYGKKEVEEWFFEFWNEPDMKDLFWYDSQEDYLTFYAQTYNAVKSISQKLRIGGPAVCNFSNIDGWLERYFTYCEAEGCLPDFFSFHFYIHNVNLDNVPKGVYSEITRVTLSDDPDYLYKCIHHIRELTSGYNYNQVNTHMTEWNASPSHRDLSRDTLFMASYIVKNILENLDHLSSFGYWTITDYIEEFPLPKECFHGGLGVITANGIKKAGYHAFTFLKRLGTNKISSGPGYYITSDERGYQILLYNYCHYDPLYCSMDHSAITYTDRYNIFRDNTSKTVQLNLKGFHKASYKIAEQSVSRKHGSSFDAWVDMGSPEKPTSENIEYLKSKAIPHYHEEVIEIENTYLLQRCLTPHEIRIIEFIAL